ncbi:FadR/GntR family transcriptional regulator [Sphingomonas sp. Root241]|uniref:FadR/GntR family transcriptional regulator n=1 Tax=Sphingomonas sp. Root241 TaxID=1736501 RepID=UPI0006FBF39A|nr:FCD domain-containing protein [Sphingomonas sp. Root241]KRC78872.1 GntR family transcriptional regulator [Sphingomonas sp. Root241]
MADRRLFQGITERIIALIEDGSFPVGSRLPGERELSERFGVSRVTIREAEIALQAAGWVRIKTGSGVYVLDRPASAQSALPTVSAFELTEARSLFEAEAAALAAPIISEDDLDKLDGLLAIMADESLDEDAISAADRDFHMTIASASGNRAIIHVVGSMWQLRTELPEVRESHTAVCRQDAQARQAEHAEIVAALRDRDVNAARLAMRRHFNRLLESMLSAAEERALQELQQRSAQSRERFLLSARLG